MSKHLNGLNGSVDVRNGMEWNALLNGNGIGIEWVAVM